MVLYLIIIGFSMLIVSVFNAVFTSINVWVCIGMTVLIVAMLVAIDAIVAIVTRWFPQKNFDPGKKIFRERKHEKGFYNFLAVAKWKDYVPESGKALVKFDKRQIADKNDPKYLYKFLTEIGYAEIMHIISAPLSFLVILFLPFNFTLTFCLPLAFVNCVLQLMPYFVQRYNRPRLYKIYLFLVKKQKREVNNKVQESEQTTFNAA